MPKSSKLVQNRYSALIEAVFKKHFRKGILEFKFERDEIVSIASDLEIALPKNVGDVIYSFRYRVDLPEQITQTAKKDMEWVIEGIGKASYRFRMVKFNRIVPRAELLTVKIPDSTPEIISKHALGDEQALLAKVRYNRLIDIFLGITSYSLQNHLRTTVKEMGQIEIDEIYVGVDHFGRQFVVPVQAKGGNDKHGMVQTLQDAACCAEKFPHLICRPVSAQFMDDGRIAMFELITDAGDVKIVRENHYKLVRSAEISAKDLTTYSTLSKPHV
ncbi:MAG: endonuclease [Burkholderiales bacterium]|nr:MAG: endonuclease [Burkholderiales bacterium]